MQNKYFFLSVNNGEVPIYSYMIIKVTLQDSGITTDINIIYYHQINNQKFLTAVGFPISI